MTYDTVFITYAVLYISSKGGYKFNFETFINSQLMSSGKMLSIMKRHSHKKGRKRKTKQWGMEIESNWITSLRHMKMIFYKSKWNEILKLFVWHNLYLLSEPLDITCLPHSSFCHRYPHLLSLLHPQALFLVQTTAIKCLLSEQPRPCFL